VITRGAFPHFVPDGNAPRVFLGPLALFQQQQGFQLPAQAHASAAGVGVGIATGPARAARRQADKIPRPPNAWILFRKHFHAASVRDHPELNNNQICKSSNSSFRLIKLTDYSDPDCCEVEG
jgi:hypothetical protein